MASATTALTKSFRVLVAEPVDRSGIDILRTVADVDIKTKLSPEQLCEIIGVYDALMVRSGTRVTEKIIQAGRKLKIIGRAGVGVDNVDVAVATSRGIFVVNSPQGNTIAAAEHTVALMFSLARKIPMGDASLRAGKWEREKFMGSQLQHKTLGIIGLGQVGSHVAKLCREVGMDLICHDPYVNVAKAEALGCRVVELEELLRESDVITLHVPLIPETKHLINEDALQKMKTTALLINCSRGGVVDETALCCALQNGRLGGAALDVFETEGKMEKDSTLTSTPNLVLTPHLGASTLEAQINVAVDVAQQIRSTLLGSLPESAVNIPGLRAAELVQLRPLIECCEILGRLAVQLLTKPLEQITVAVEGMLAANTEKPELLLMAAANGAIGIHKAFRVNFVNVRQIAEQHRINMVLVKDESSGKKSISVEVRSATRTAHIRGTITEDDEVLLTSFDGIPVYMILPTSISRINYPATIYEAEAAMQTSPVGLESKVPMNEKDPKWSTSETSIITNGVKEVMTERQEDNQQPQPSPKRSSISSTAGSEILLLYSRHDDVPGVIAAITSVLAEAGVNIANCHLGRERSIAAGSVQRAALAIFHIDDACSPEVVETVQAIKAVRVCKLLKV